MKFSIEICPLGMIVRGEVPFPDLVHIERMAQGRGFNIIDAALSGALGASMVLTSKKKSDVWRFSIQKEQDEIMLSPKRDFAEKAALYLGDADQQYIDAGASSKSLFRFLSGKLGKHRIALPRDAEDFGRCVRMLELFPQYKGWHLESTKCPAELVKFRDRWAHLKELYDAGDPLLSKELGSLSS